MVIFYIYKYNLSEPYINSDLKVIDIFKGSDKFLLQKIYSTVRLLYYYYIFYNKNIMTGKR